MEILVILGYNDAGTSRSISVPWPTIRSVASGDMAIEELTEEQTKAFVHQSFLREADDCLVPAPRLYEKAGIPAPGYLYND